MLKPNPTVASMAAYALPDISAVEGVEAIGLDASDIEAGGYLFMRRNLWSNN
jgi:hypothetical protein